MDRMNEISGIFPTDLREIIHFERLEYDQLREIRVRVNQNIRIQYGKREITIPQASVSLEQIYQIIEKACEYSLYSYEENMKQGFITIKGGHRIGIGGHVVTDNTHIKVVSRISFLCIRIAHEVIGCADSIMNFVCKKNRLAHTLIISPPGCGKTTLLRDMVRQISDGTWLPGKNVCGVDERSELAATFKGMPQNHVGIRTDVLDNCPKYEGMLMAVRSLAPQVIAVDELGGMRDVEAVMYCVHCGCIMIGTVHGLDEQEVCKRPGISELLNKKIFQRLLVLSGDYENHIRCVDLEGL